MGVNNEPVERSFPPGWFGDGWEYVFRVTQPVNKDAYQLTVLRWCGEGDDMEQMYLCSEGWRRYESYEILRDPIEMTGLRHHTEQQIQNRVIDAMVAAMTVDLAEK